MKDDKAMLSLFRFIRTFVVHLTAKRALEKYSFMTKDHEVTISHFGVERSPLFIPAGSWPDMLAILRESFSSDPKSSTSADDAVSKGIALLEDKIRTPPAECSPKCQKILRKFKKITEDMPVTLTVGMHCEAVLASLGKYYEDFLNSESESGDDNADFVSSCKVLLFSCCLLDLTFYHKNLFYSGKISVSQPCCPVCWELLALLGDDSGTSSSLRDSHSTMYPVELPIWLPEGIVDEMRKRFLNNLREEIKIMLKGAEPPPRAQVTRRNYHASNVASTLYSTMDLERNG